MASGRFSFDQFTLDLGNRTLSRGDLRIDVNSRYLDALALLVAEQGRLVSKSRFLDEVWCGVPVTEEALTQCIRTLRRHLGDDAARPQFIETVPKHGYRFVAPVEQLELLARPVPRMRLSRGQLGLLASAGTLGGAVAGLLGGLAYGFAAALNPVAPAAGAASILLVLVCVTTVIALLGAAGVAFGIAAALLAGNRLWIIAGGAIGGMTIGAVVKLLGIDAFALLVGRSPGDITGPFEGLVIGAVIGLGVWISGGRHPVDHVRRGIAASAIAGAASGTLIVALGGHMMGGSLELLERAFPGSRIRFDRVGHLLGEASFGPFSEALTAALEGALFGAFVVAAMALTLRTIEQDVQARAAS